MYEWSEEQLMVRAAVRDFVDKEIRPHRDALEFGDLPPYDLLRKMFATFGMTEMQKANFDSRIAAERAEDLRRFLRDRASRASSRRCICSPVQAAPRWISTPRRTRRHRVFPSRSQASHR